MYMSLIIANREYNRNIIVNEKIIYVVFDISGGVEQIKDLRLPFKADEVEVQSIGVSSCDTDFILAYPALECDFLDLNQILAVYNKGAPNDVVYQKKKQRFRVKFQSDEFGKNAKFRLRLITPDGIIDNTMLTGGIIISLYFVQYHRKI